MMDEALFPLIFVFVSSLFVFLSFFSPFVFQVLFGDPSSSLFASGSHLHREI